MPPTSRIITLAVLAYGLIVEPSFCQSQTTVPTTAAKREVIRVNESRTNLLLFPTGEEVFLGALNPENNDVFIAGAAGTTLSIDNSRLVLHAGQLFLNSGKSGLTIGTRLANIRLGNNTTVVLDIHPHKPLHVEILSGTAPIHIKIKERRQPLVLKSGEEIYVSDCVLPLDQYKTTDPIERQEAEKESETKGLEIVRRNFDAHKLLVWHVSQISSKDRLSGAKKEFLDKLHPTAPATNPNDQANDPWHVLASGGTEFVLQPTNTGIIQLRLGELFVFTNDNAVVETPLGEALCDKGALFAIDTSNGNMRVRALTGPGDVTVLVGKTKLPVPPGEEVMISDHTPTKDDTNPKDGIARRNPTPKPLDGKLSLTVTDFNILSLIVSAEYLKPIKKPFWSQEKSALEKLIQTAAAIETVTRSKGGYTGAPRATSPRQQHTNPGQAI